jgi:hypothetical protein
MYANQTLEKGAPTLDDSFRLIYRPLTPAEKQAYTNIVRMLKVAGAK